MESSDGRARMGGLAGKLREYGTLVMFPHTVFSMSFAVVSLLLAAGLLPPFSRVLWAMAAFMGARTGANALNRAVDAGIDAQNPRTAMRQIPRKLIAKPEAVLFACACFAVMEAAALMLNPLCFLLSPGALVLMAVYSYTKRFTWLCHLILGAATACAPVGAWIAVTGSLALTPLVLGAANMLWVAGFDVIYGTQDYEFDRTHGLHSIPVRFGIRRALGIAAAFHAAAALLLSLTGYLCPQLGFIYQAGVCVIAALFAAEHLLVSPNDLSRVKLASYGINQIVSFVYMIAGISDIFM